MTDTTNDRWISLADHIAEEVLAAHADDVDQNGRWPAEAIAVLRESGLLGLTVAAELGGAAGGPRTFAAVTRALAERCASTAMIYVMHVCATQAIAAAPAFSLREDLLRNIAAGRHLSTLALSERGSRSHFWVPMNAARHEGNVDVLTAQKSFVTSAGRADSCVVSMRSPDAAAPTDSTLYYVPRDAAGLKVSGPWNGLGLRGNASAPVQLDEVRVPATHRISAEGEGFPLTMTAVLPLFQLGSAAVSVGIARAATESIRQHLLNSRLEHLDQSLASLPNLRMRLAQMQIAVDTQEAFLGHVAGEMENPGPNTLLAVLESKAAAAEAALTVTDLAMRTGGGASFARRLSVERNFRDARASSIMAPTTDVLHDFVGKTLLEMPLL